VCVVCCAEWDLVACVLWGVQNGTEWRVCCVVCRMGLSGVCVVCCAEWDICCHST
jgi:hypothetical protein